MNNSDSGGCLNDDVGGSGSGKPEVEKICEDSSIQLIAEGNERSPPKQLVAAPQDDGEAIQPFTLEGLS